MPGEGSVTAPAAGVARAAGYEIAYHRADECARVIDDVFKARDYDLGDLGRAPRIVDGGAYIGVAALFFRKRYPDARIVSIEPSPETWPLLRENLARNRIQGVETINAALAARAGEIPFHVIPGGSWGDSMHPDLWPDLPEPREIRVPAIPLADVLTEPTALLKLDIEGAETRVLAAAGDALQSVERIVLEFHGSAKNPDNGLDELLRVLQTQGFAVEIMQDGAPIAPERVRRTEPFWLMMRAWAPGTRRRRWWPGWLPAWSRPV